MELYMDNGDYRVHINTDGKQMFLGTFSDSLTGPIWQIKSGFVLDAKAKQSTISPHDAADGDLEIDQVVGAGQTDRPCCTTNKCNTINLGTRVPSMGVLSAINHQEDYMRKVHMDLIENAEDTESVIYEMGMLTRLLTKAALDNGRPQDASGFKLHIINASRDAAASQMPPCFEQLIAMAQNCELDLYNNSDHVVVISDANSGLTAFNINFGFDDYGNLNTQRVFDAIDSIFGEHIECAIDDLAIYLLG